MDIYTFLKDFQTLIAGILALSGASMVLLSTRMQIKAIRRRSTLDTLKTAIIHFIAKSEKVNKLNVAREHTYDLLVDVREQKENPDCTPMSEEHDALTSKEETYLGKIEEYSKELDEFTYQTKMCVYEMQILLNGRKETHQKLSGLIHEWLTHTQDFEELLKNIQENKAQLSKLLTEFSKLRSEIIDVAKQIIDKSEL